MLKACPDVVNHELLNYVLSADIHVFLYEIVCLICDDKSGMTKMRGILPYCATGRDYTHFKA